MSNVSSEATRAQRGAKVLDGEAEELAWLLARLQETAELHKVRLAEHATNDCRLALLTELLDSSWSGGGGAEGQKSAHFLPACLDLVGIQAGRRKMFGIAC